MRWAVAAVLILLPCAADAAACHAPTKAQIGAATASSGALVATVGDAPITGFDWQQAVALRVVLDGSDPDASALKGLAKEELARLKTNEAWIADARDRNVAITPAEVDTAIAAVLAHDHVTAVELVARLKCGGVEMASLRGRVAIALAHAKAIGVTMTLPFRIAQRG